MITQTKRMCRIRITHEVWMDWLWVDGRYIRWAWERLKLCFERKS